MRKLSKAELLELAEVIRKVNSPDQPSLRFNENRIEIKHKGKWVPAMRFLVREIDAESGFAHWCPDTEILVPKAKEDE